MKEQEIIGILRVENPEFRQLEEDHRALETRLTELESRGFLTAEEEMEIKVIKKQKLAKKDRMAAFIRGFRNTAAMN